MPTSDYLTAPPSVVPGTGSLVALRYLGRDMKYFPRLAPTARRSGGHHARARGRGMDFDEVRPYQPGDDARAIDWRVTAKTTKPHTKLYREERERPLILIVDLRLPMLFGSVRSKSVAASEIAAALAWAGCARGDRVGALVFGAGGQQDIRARQGHQNVLRLINVLANTSASLLAADVTQETTLQDMIEEARRIAHPGATVAIVSDFHDFTRDCESPLFAIAQHCDLNMCRIYDELDEHLPAPGRYSVTNGRQQAVLDTRQVRVRRSFEQTQQRTVQELSRAVSRLQATFLDYRTDQNVAQCLRHYYGSRIRGRRR